MKNKTTYFITCLLALVLFVVACKKDEKRYHYIPENRKVIYNTGDLLIYKSDSGHIDTLVVGQYVESMSPGKDSHIDFCESIKIDFHNIKDTLYNPDDYRTVKTRISQYVNNYDYCQDYFGWNEIGFVYPDDGTNIGSIVINSKSYNDVYLFINDTTNTASDKVYRLYYHPKYGFLKIENKSGEIWELQ